MGWISNLFKKDQTSQQSRSQVVINDNGSLAMDLEDENVRRAVLKYMLPDDYQSLSELQQRIKQLEQRKKAANELQKRNISEFKTEVQVKYTTPL